MNNPELLPEPGVPTFTGHWDPQNPFRLQSITVDALPPVIRTSREFLELITLEASKFIWVDEEGLLHIEVENAQVIYRKIRDESVFGGWHTSLWVAEGG